jgi:hypothetical protein
MSSDLLEDCEDKKGVDCGLVMNAHSYAWLSIGDDGVFELSPDEHGFKNAQSIIDALSAWIAQVKSTQ